MGFECDDGRIASTMCDCRDELRNAFARDETAH
jgi:hypothetical protein